MPEKHPNTERWGGPGASHEDRSKPKPEPQDTRPDGAPTNPRVSQVSGGGGERDEKHSHDDSLRHSKSHATDSPSPTSSRAYRPNRSRNDQERDAAAAGDTEDADFTQDDAEADPPSFHIQVNTDDHVDGHERLIAYVETTVARGLGRFEAQLTRVEVFLSDSNGAKSGPADKACSIEARPTGRAPMAATDQAPTVEDALRGAIHKLARRLDSELGRRSDHKGAESIRGGF